MKCLNIIQSPTRSRSELQLKYASQHSTQEAAQHSTAQRWMFCKLTYLNSAFCDRPTHTTSRNQVTMTENDIRVSTWLFSTVCWICGKRPEYISEFKPENLFTKYRETKRIFLHSHLELLSNKYIHALNAPMSLYYDLRAHFQSI